MQFISPELVQKLIEIVALVVISILGYGAKRLVSMAEAYLDQKIGVSKTDQLKGYALTIVRAFSRARLTQTGTALRRKRWGWSP